MGSVLSCGGGDSGCRCTIMSAPSRYITSGLHDDEDSRPPSHPLPSPPPLKVLHSQSGRVIEAEAAVDAADLMMAFPGHFVCHFQAACPSCPAPLLINPAPPAYGCMKQQAAPESASLQLPLQGGPARAQEAGQAAMYSGCNALPRGRHVYNCDNVNIMDQLVSLDHLILLDMIVQARVMALPADEELSLGHIYLLLPFKKRHSRLSREEAASFLHALLDHHAYNSDSPPVYPAYGSSATLLHESSEEYGDDDGCVDDEPVAYGDSVCRRSSSLIDPEALHEEMMDMELADRFNSRPRMFMWRPNLEPITEVELE